ncbi:type I-E CRISPR-associated protein Cas5/CasD [Limnobaculum parvum]|uniref:Type I-E CRISPR-associated protein Cas5/CasD n=1 Tax=Limnobaculum parvum TaxID=2172103 RepID=A0A2Y9TVU2_9GAMM|nr:type I-E CRISPR-associated protein Cas5/CasD [Limnobaculum parvum]AWH87650.1 type I-E CRISPR-associated protein Cas5/CasD [Limnobaculum parvum]
MSQYLLFQIYSPFVSWGEAAVGEVRHTSSVPSRSALLGILAAALGIRRDEEQRLAVFNQHYEFAVRPYLSREQWLRDYQTIEVPKENRKRHYFTRRDELTLAPDELNTMLTFREYHTDAFYFIAVRETVGAPVGLDKVADALRNPVFPLYFGRKSCPPALPLSPQILQGTLSDVLCQALEHALLNNDSPLFTLLSGENDLCYWEGEHEGMTVVETRQRSDQPLSRQRWQFTTRLQHSGNIKGDE